MASELSLACLLGRLVRFTAYCLSVFVSFPLSASLSRRKACTQRPASFEDGLSDFASSLYWAGEGGGEQKKKRRIGRALLRSRYTRYFRESSTVHVQVKQLSRCLWTRSRAQPRVITENGGRGCLHFLRRFQFLFQVTTQQRYVRIIVVETEKLHTMTIYILRRSNDNLYTLFLDILRLHPQTIFQIIVDIITYNNFFQS